MFLLKGSYKIGARLDSRLGKFSAEELDVFTVSKQHTKYNECVSMKIEGII